MQILTKQLAIEGFEQFNLTQPLAIDLETNALEVWEVGSRIVSMSIAGVSKTSGTWTALQFPIAHREGTNVDSDVVPYLVERLENARLVPFWVPMEASWLLAKYGIRPNWVGDAYFIARIAQLKDSGLKDLVRRYLQVIPLEYEEVCTHESHDYSYVHAQDPKGIRYSEDDAINAGRLEAVLRSKFIAPANMQAVYELEVQAAAMMAEFSVEGYVVDVDKLRQELEQESANVLVLEEEIYSTIGARFKINSGPQLGKELARKWGLHSPRRTEKGAESWAQDAIQELVVNTGVTNVEANVCLKKIQEWKTRFSTMNSLRQRSTELPVDGKFHPTWKTIGFDGTTRMYSENPSMTSLPKSARRALVAPAGKKWVKFDWRQAEVRILAALSGDEALKLALDSGDYHRAVYAGMTGSAFDEVTKEQRESSKVVTFSILYSGGSPFHVASELRISEEEAAGHIARYFQMFPKLSAFLQKTSSIAATTGAVTTWMNRVRRLDTEDLRKAQNQACNSMGQQSCGTLLKQAMIRLHQAFLYNHPLLKGYSQPIPVFDALFYLIDADVHLENHIKYVKTFVELELNGIVLEAEFETGDTWGTVGVTFPPTTGRI